jgi:electron transfer flavoprotein beta subunit
MNIAVFVKRVPDTKEADLVIDKDGRNIVEKDLVFDINESDKYAVEEAVRLKEKYGGSVTAITLGTEAAEDVLRRSLATGVEKATRLSDAAFNGSDADTTARILSRSIKDQQFDLILTGVQASDDIQSYMGPAVAEYLKLPHATVVNKIEVLDGKVKVHRELEGELEEVLEIKLPAVLSIQTGINEPRYVSIMGIRKASRLEIKVAGMPELGFAAGEVGEAAARVKIDRVYVPPVTKATEILSGSLDDMTTKLAGILKDKGGLA